MSTCFEAFGHAAVSQFVRVKPFLAGLGVPRMGQRDAVKTTAGESEALSALVSLLRVHQYGVDRAHTAVNSRLISRSID